MSSGTRQPENCPLSFSCHIYADPNLLADQLPPVRKPTRTRRQSSSLSGLTERPSTVAARDGEALSGAVGAHTITHITQMWADRLRLTGISVSKQHRDEKTGI
jgi:hypothetical protein